MILIIANLLPSSSVSHVKELKLRYSKLMAIIALAVGKIKHIPMCNFVFEFISPAKKGRTAKSVAAASPTDNLCFEFVLMAQSLAGSILTIVDASDVT
jgi:hypothetical protein